jgi:hypothetical protein
MAITVWQVNSLIRVVVLGIQVAIVAGAAWCLLNLLFHGDATGPDPEVLLPTYALHVLW